MPDLPLTSIDGVPGEHGQDVDASAEVGASAPPLSGDGAGDVVPLVEERLDVSKRRRRTGIVRVGTRTEVVDATAAVELDRYRVQVERVPVGRVVPEAPQARAEGDTTIIPVVEERLVVVKQLVLVEEIHIRHVVERETASETLQLRRQRAVVERLDAAGGTVVAHESPGPTSD